MEATPRSSRTPTLTRPLSILLVESNADNRDLYVEYFRSSSADIAAVETADAALAMAPFADIIVTALRVAGTFDGIELVQRLRADHHTRRTPIIVLTACAFEREEQRSFAAGCDLFLKKPCEPETLAKAINHLMTAR